MRNRLYLLIFIILYGVSDAQVISISPLSAYPGQVITATIVLTPGAISAANPPDTLTDIYLEQSGNRIYTDAFTVNQVFPGSAPYTDSLSTNFTIPVSPIPGWYDVHVITYAPGNIPVDNVLINGFLVPLAGSCPVPFNVTADTVTAASEFISWSPSVIADTFRIRYRLHGTTNYFYKDVDGAGNVSSATIFNLDPGSLYDVDVSTRCTGISSTYSVPIDTFTTLSQTFNCVIPFGISVSLITSTTAQVNWSNLVVSDTFRIRYYIPGPNIYLYRDVNGAGPHSYILTNLAPGTNYNIQISSICAGIGNGYSFAVPIVTGAGVSCIVPWGLDTSNVTGNSAVISWSPVVTADTFRIRYRDISVGIDMYKDVNGLAGNSTTLQNLLPNSTYLYQVSSVCSGSGTGYSTSRTFLTQNIYAACITIPFGLSSNVLSNSSATVSWSPLVTADSFLVRYSVNMTTNYVWKMVGGNLGNSTTLTGLTPNTTYQWQVRTSCNGAPLTSYSVQDIFGTPLRLAHYNNSVSSLELFPDPASDKLNIQFSYSKNENVVIRIVDLSGRVVRNENIMTFIGLNRYETSVKDFASGIYNVLLISQDEISHRQLFVVN